MSTSDSMGPERPRRKTRHDGVETPRKSPSENGSRKGARAAADRERIAEAQRAFDVLLRPAPFADFAGFSERTVYRYLDKGMPSLGHQGHARLIPVSRALRWLEKRGSRRGRPRNVDRGRGREDE